MGELKIIFSIITPTYNNADVISRAIESIKSQTYIHWELIIVDDGSTDNTKEVVQKYLGDNRIKYIRLQKNSGVNRARNIGFDNISDDTNFVTFLDSDDMFFPNALDIMKETISNYPGYKVYSFGVIDSKGKQCSFIQQNNLCEANYMDMLGITGKIFGEWVHCFNAECIKNKEFRYEEKVKNGYESIAYLRFAKKFPFLHVNQVVRKYFIDNESLTRVKNITTEKAKDIVTGLHIFLNENKEILKNNPKLLAKHLSVLGKMLLISGKKEQALNVTLEALQYNFFELRCYRNFLLIIRRNEK